MWGAESSVLASEGSAGTCTKQAPLRSTRQCLSLSCCPLASAASLWISTTTHPSCWPGPRGDMGAQGACAGHAWGWAAGRQCPLRHRARGFQRCWCCCLCSAGAQCSASAGARGQLVWCQYHCGAGAQFSASAGAQSGAGAGCGAGAECDASAGCGAGAGCSAGAGCGAGVGCGAGAGCRCRCRVPGAGCGAVPGAARHGQ